MYLEFLSDFFIKFFNKMGYIIYPVLSGILLIILLAIFIPIARRHAARKKESEENKLRQTMDDDTDDDGEDDGILETPELTEDVMTTQEKRAYHYFIDDNTKKKGGCLRKGKKDGVTDEEYEQIVTDKLNDFGSKSRALGKIGLDETQVNEIEPIRFFGYEKHSRRLNNNYMSKLGEDGRWRSSVCSITWLFFSDNQILVYTGRFDLFTSSKHEMTTEYYYKDIINFYTFVETDQKIELKPRKGGCLKKRNKVDTERKLTDHDTFGLAVSGDKFSCSVSGVANAKQIIDGVKQKLREKKGF